MSGQPSQDYADLFPQTADDAAHSIGRSLFLQARRTRDGEPIAGTDHSAAICSSTTNQCWSTLISPGAAPAPSLQLSEAFSPRFSNDTVASPSPALKIATTEA